MSSRRAEVTRATKETDIRCAVDVDGVGAAEASTGLPFFDHMLVTLGKHALFDLNVACKGDLHVDMHHTVEDTGIVLGQALDRALGDRAGIVRAGWSYFPLDEALARCVVDLSGRSYLVWQVEMDQSPRAPMDLTVLEGFFKAMCDHARFNLHVTLLAGRDFHHGCEAIFKAFARALRQACAVDPRAGGAVPSTKGVL